MTGRGGTWNRAGRRSGGYKPIPIYITRRRNLPQCEWPGCTALATVRLLDHEDSEAEMYVCEEHRDEARRVAGTNG